jgi:multiple sugar transport system substrate-binding protein
MNNIELKGITWDHPRGYQPLYASSDRFKKERNITVTWTKRSLKDFGDTSVKSLSEKYDLLIIDHPHIGSAAETGCIIKLNDLLMEDELALFAKQSVGPCYLSYHYSGYQWALPIDAACQVASYRPDLFHAEIPKTWEQVFDLSNRLKEKRQFIGMALCPTDCTCTFLNLSAQFNTLPGENTSELIDEQSGIEILKLMSRLKHVCHPNSLNWNPINLYDYMVSGNEVSYCPLAFGYVNYSMTDTNGHSLKYTGIPGKSGALLGGAGIAISSRCKNIDAALAYVKWICDPQYQKTKYIEEGGQPAQTDAWLDKQANALSNNFFLDTLETIEHAYLRPRFPQWPVFQEYLGDIVHDFLSHEKNPQIIISEINAAYKKVSIETTDTKNLNQ